MSTQTNRVKVKFQCKAGHLHESICVAIDRGVPPELRCALGASSGTSNGGGCKLPDDWQQRVERELRDNFEESKRRGFVLVVEGK
ncbi:hypothetical protein GCM10027052_26540 [Parafrigoribacterium mesophilum]